MPARLPPDAALAPAITPARHPAGPAVWRTGAAAAPPVPAPTPAGVPSPSVGLDVPDGADDEVAAGYVDLVEGIAPPAPVRQPPDTDFLALEKALSERILRQLAPRVESLVAERLDQVMQGLACSLRAGLGESVAHAVAHAVQQELASLRAQKR